MQTFLLGNVSSSKVVSPSLNGRMQMLSSEDAACVDWNKHIPSGTLGSESYPLADHSRSYPRRRDGNDFPKKDE